MTKKAANFYLLFFSLLGTLLLAEGVLVFVEAMQNKKDFKSTSGTKVNHFASRGAGDVLTSKFVNTFNGCLLSSGLVQEDPALGFFNIPDQQGYMFHVDDWVNLVVPMNFDLSLLGNRKYYSSTFRINNEGNRGGQMVLPKPADVFRIVFIGDSVTFGYYVDENDTFAKVVENLMQSKGLKGRRVEIVNAGVSGLGSSNILAHLKKRVLAWDPDLVVWGFYLNDVTPREGDVLFPTRDLGAWSFLNHFAIGRLVKRVIFLMPWGAKFEVDHKSLSNQKVDESWRAVVSDFSQAKSLLDQKNVKIIAVCLPCGLQIGRLFTVSEYQRKLERICNRLSIPFLDVLPALNSAGTAQMLYFKGDFIHPNAKGHRIIGKVLADFISNQVILNTDSPQAENMP